MKYKKSRMFEDTICPICKGKGHYLKRVVYTQAFRKKAVDLFKKGIGLREIGRKIHLHPQSVKVLMKGYKK